ncbi:MAG: hypothetical protein A2W17_12540 [Planctomycetes bacterium RBG_16_41_13]|nr:MAG: hypothetical protein A2W17_12540 [Planctomycetes bacterium RBG_16_41_13]
MNNEFMTAREQIGKMFPACSIELGYSQYSHQDIPMWWVQIKPYEKAKARCEHCKSILEENTEIRSYNHITPEDLINHLKTLQGGVQHGGE